MDEPEHTDVVVIGMGPGGEYAAGALAEAGLHVTGVEARLVGGECPYYGCVPSKMMIRAANLIAETRRVPGMAGTSTVTPDWSPVARRIREEATDYWNDKVAADRFEGKGGHLVRGHGTITGPGQVTVGTADGARVFLARRGIVINSGTEPAIPPIEGLAGTPYWTNRDIVQAEEVPRVPDRARRRGHRRRTGPGVRPVRRGGHRGRGAAQAAVVRGTRGQRPDRADLHARGHQGVHRAPRPSGSATTARCFTVRLGNSALTAERLLVATGRRMDLAGLGVAAVGLDEKARSIPTDGWMRAADGVWAHRRRDRQGRVHAHVHVPGRHRGPRHPRLRAGSPPTTAPYPGSRSPTRRSAASGLTEAQARAAGLRVRTGMTQVPYSARGWIHKAGNDGFIKVIEDADRSVLVGATSAGPWGGEVLSALQVAVRAEVPVATLRNMPYAYPTFYRAIEDALRDLGSS